MDFWRVRAGSGLVTAAAAVAARRASSAARNVERGRSRRGELDQAQFRRVRIESRRFGVEPDHLLVAQVIRRLRQLASLGDQFVIDGKHFSKLL